ncbi:MAG TPA: hypothetical protein VJ761_08425 [Ktedonobacteraceae bacterium]|nr:hypothetical protein [Ktedonobacteraceae bacterium]
MNDIQQEQFYDNDVEITDLPEETNADRRLGRRRERAGQAPPLLERWLFRRRLSPRQRFLQGAAISGSVALIVLIVLASSATTRNALLTGIAGRQPTSVPASVPNTNLFYIQGSPSWGRASLDGHVLTRLPVVGVDQPLRLARGLHVVQWRAAPFQPQSCLIAIPPMTVSNNCVEADAIQLKSGLFASVIMFSESLDSLDANQREALTKTAQLAVNGLKSIETVRPGEQYIDRRPELLSATASQQMHATLNFQLDTAAASNATCVSSLGRSVISSCQDCRRFCTAPDQVFPIFATNQPWNVLALVSATWKFTTLNGQIVAQNQPDSANEQAEYLVELSITWDGTIWHVTALADNSGVPALGNVGCTSAMEDIGNTGYNILPGGGGVEEAVNWRFVSGSNLASGCLAVGTSQQSTPDQPVLPQPYLLHRFGLVIAANAAAHRYWPFLPFADTYEQHLVLQLAAKMPATVDTAVA